METIVSVLRDVVGTPSFTDSDLGPMFEYVLAGMLCCIVVSSIFKIVVGVFKK